ncbi:hemicentin-1-like [Haliotis rufescens]|uniref:hemicentin-1-like n=1 Tax=Haliotis rufescens TaxID=6454 RepID=UPI00201F9D2A|nr:hemicentin-1-like [Haliotis rufescens]
MDNKMGSAWTWILSVNVVLCALIGIPHGTEACGGRYTSTSGSFTSPHYPSNYGQDISCTYTVDIGSAFVILSFQDFSTESGHDFVKVYSASKDLLASLSGDNAGYVVQPATFLRVVFTTDTSGSGRGFKAVWKQIADAPSVTGLPAIIHMNESSSLMIDCSTYTKYDNSSTPTYKWTHGAATVNTESVLQRRHITRRQGGEYTCTVSNTVGSVSATVTVDVQYAPLISGFPTIFSTTEYSRLEIDCSDYTVVGNPTLTTYKWTTRGSTFTSESALDRGNISRNEGGQYTCTASNAVGSVSSSISIDVHYAPSISDLPSTYPVRESSRLSIYCRRYIIQGNPSSTTYKWTHDGSTVSTRVRLSRPSITRHEAGEYTCTATNPVGSASVRVRVDVHSPPLAPTDFQVVAVTDTAVLLQWISSYNGGANQTFILMYKSDLHLHWTTWNDGIRDPGRNIQVREDIPVLTPTQGYQFKLHGTNIYGDGETVILTSRTFSSGNHEKIIGLGTALGACVIVIAIIVIKTFLRRQTQDKKQTGKIQMDTQMHSRPLEQSEGTNTSTAEPLRQNEYIDVKTQVDYQSSTTKDMENEYEQLELKPPPAIEASDTDLCCHTADLNNDSVTRTYPMYVTTL